MFEAMITNTWLAGRTERLRVGSLVLCDSFRHPAVLAAKRSPSTRRREDGTSWHRWGSVPAELDTFGIGSLEQRSG